MPDSFTDAALVLLGHGSTRDVEAAAPVFQHAAELRRRQLFAEVREAFWKQEPRVNGVLARLAAPRVFIVPLFISDGYFAGEVIPRELGFGPSRVIRQPPRPMFYCQPVGTHPAMTGVLLDRARAVVEQFPFPRPPAPKSTTLFIAGHGTERHEKSRDAIERQADAIRARNEYAAVHAVFLEEEPRVGDCYRLAQTRQVIVAPFFIGDGPHTQHDIPVLLGEAPRLAQQRRAAGKPAWRNPTERNGKLVWYAPVAGTAPRVAEVILDCARHADAKEK